jgi:ferric-dicitrate binding protein FerR (iron transport regulator)
MTLMPCPRLVEAEALRDGRLRDAERTSFERHMAECSPCARESRALEQLAQALRASPSERTDELRVRRELGRLLSAFERQRLAPVRPPTGGRWLVWLSAAAVILAAIVAFGQVRRMMHSPGGGPPIAVIQAESHTAWSERIDDNRETVLLDHGLLFIRVEHGSGGRLIVLLPDGQLEDIGTTFAVSAENGRTTRVTVQEGSVVLRIRGLPPIAIGPGNPWTVDAPRAAASSCPSSPPAIEPASRMQLPPRPARSAHHETAPVTSVASPDTFAEFRMATVALDRGDNRAAAMAFGIFVARHPSDPRAQDAAYLRIIALQRSGDGAVTRDAAAEYLRRYPSGFRRAEVESLLRSGPSAGRATEPTPSF